MLILVSPSLASVHLFSLLAPTSLTHVLEVFLSRDEENFALQANTISQKNEHMMSNKAIGVEARCEASAILPSYGHGSTPGMDEFGNTLDNWLVSDFFSSASASFANLF